MKVVIYRPYLTGGFQLCAAVRPCTVPYGDRTAYYLDCGPNGDVPMHWWLSQFSLGAEHGPTKPVTVSDFHHILSKIKELKPTI